MGEKNSVLGSSCACYDIFQHGDVGCEVTAAGWCCFVGCAGDLAYKAFVDLDTVSKFQGALTHLARCRYERGDSLWRDSFHTSSEIWTTRLMMT